MTERQSFRLALLLAALLLLLLALHLRPSNVLVVWESLRVGETRWTALRTILNALYP